MNICYSCRISKGFRPKDKGAHTAIMKVCDSCQEKKIILGDRHWIADYFVYDGRANYCIDDALVLEVISGVSEDSAISRFKRQYSDIDAVLFDSQNNLIFNGN